ncbi:MAG: response regulator [Opitutaceae bacterium]|jgi:signal transduction histidine kinase
MQDEPIIIETPEQTFADRPLVLLVDDELGPRESIGFALSSEFCVESADRAADALRMVREKQYAAILLDIRMPEMDGIQALEEIRKIDSDVSVVMLTGYGTLLTAQQSMLAGANQYLRKPPDINELLESLRRQTKATHLRRHQTQMDQETHLCNVALKQEIAQIEPKLWHVHASVELVHDLTNPLMVTIGYATLLSEEAKLLSDNDPDRSKRLVQYAGMVSQAAEYAHHLAENWRQAADPAKDLKNIDLVQVIQEVNQVIFFDHSAIHITGLASAPIRGLKFQLMRVFQNLLKNGFEAGATHLTVAVSRNDDKFEVQITDNGQGMTNEVLDKVMKGSFTTKETGLGMGLNICRHLLTAHGASLNIETNSGMGTTITMLFPSAD